MAARTTTRKPAAKKPVAKKPVAKKPAAKKTVAKKAAAKKKAVAKKAVAKKPVAKKAVAKKPVAKKTPAVKESPVPRTAKTEVETLPEGMPAVGSAAPDFTLQDQDGTSFQLSAQRGRSVVIYFYPRDNTPGCTTEAQQFSELLGQFEARNTVVVGISTDTVQTHQKFRIKCALSVPLLADPEQRAHTAFGTWREKLMYGRATMGTLRSTFLIGADGVIKRVWPKVKADGHAAEVLAALDA